MQIIGYSSTLNGVGKGGEGPALRQYPNGPPLRAGGRTSASVEL